MYFSSTILVVALPLVLALPAPVKQVEANPQILGLPLPPIPIVGPILSGLLPGPSGLPLPTGILTALPLPTGILTGLPLPTGILTGLPLPTGILTGLPLPTGIPTGLPLPTGILTGLPLPTGILTGLPLPTGILTTLPIPTGVLPLPLPTVLPLPPGLLNGLPLGVLGPVLSNLVSSVLAILNNILTGFQGIGNLLPIPLITGLKTSIVNLQEIQKTLAATEE